MFQVVLPESMKTFSLKVEQFFSKMVFLLTKEHIVIFNMNILGQKLVVWTKNQAPYFLKETIVAVPQNTLWAGGKREQFSIGMGFLLNSGMSEWNIWFILWNFRPKDVTVELPTPLHFSIERNTEHCGTRCCSIS